MLKSINMSDPECNQIVNDDKSDEISLDTLLLDLKIISNIKEFDKISIKKNIEIDTPHIFQSVSRKLNGDSRERTIKYISDVINNIFLILDNLLKEETKTEIITTENYLNKKYNFKSETVSIYQTISQNLAESIAGLQNLKITYLNDITTTAKIDMLIIKIQNRIAKINNMMIINPEY